MMAGTSVTIDACETKLKINVSFNFGYFKIKTNRKVKPMSINKKIIAWQKGRNFMMGRDKMVMVDLNMMGDG